MAIADTGIQGEFFGAAGLLDGSYQLDSLWCADMACAVIDHGYQVIMIVDIDQVAAKGDFTCPNINPHACRFKRGSAGIIFFRFITHERKVGHITARRVAFRHGPHQERFASCTQPVDLRLICSLKRGLITQFRYRGIPHAVTDEQDVFHQSAKEAVSASIRILTVGALTTSSLSISARASRTDDSWAVWVVMTMETGPLCWRPF